METLLGAGIQVLAAGSADLCGSTGEARSSQGTVAELGAQIICWKEASPEGNDLVITTIAMQQQLRLPTQVRMAFCVQMHAPLPMQGSLPMKAQGQREILPLALVTEFIGYPTAGARGFARASTSGERRGGAERILFLACQQS